MESGFEKLKSGMSHTKKKEFKKAKKKAEKWVTAQHERKEGRKRKKEADTQKRSKYTHMAKT